MSEPEGVPPYRRDLPPPSIVTPTNALMLHRHGYLTDDELAEMCGMTLEQWQLVIGAPAIYADLERVDKIRHF